MIEIQILFTQFQRESYPTIKKMIESYDARRQRYCDKLLYNEFHDSQIEKLGFSQNIEDLKISLLKLTQDLKNIEAYGVENLINNLMNIIQNYHNFCLNLNYQRRSKIEVDDKNNRICTNCKEHIEKISIKKMKDKFSLTEAEVKQSEIDIKKSMVQEENQFKEYLIFKNQFIVSIDEILTSKQRKIVTSTKELAKTYQYLSQIIQDFSQQKIDMSEYRIQNIKQSKQLDSIIEKLKQKIVKLFIKLMMKQKNTKKKSVETECQTNTLEVVEKLKYFQYDNIKLNKQLQLLQQSKAHTEGEAIRHIKKYNEMQVKIIQNKQQIVKNQELNKKYIDQIENLKQKLDKQKKWKIAHEQSIIKPFKNEIEKNKKKEYRYQQEIKKLKIKINLLQESTNQQQQNIYQPNPDPVDSQTLNSIQTPNEYFYGEKHKSIKKKKYNKREILQNSLMKMKNHLKISRQYSLLINQQEGNKYLKIRRSVRVRPSGRVETPKNINISNSKIDTSHVADEQENNKVNLIKSQLRGSQKIVKYFKTEENKENNHLKLSEKCNNFNKFKNSKISVMKLKINLDGKIKKDQKQVSKVIQLKEQHLYLFGGQKAANQYEKNKGIWPYIDTADKLIIDYENTHLSVEIQKYFNWLEIKHNSKYRQYRHFLKYPIEYLKREKIRKDKEKTSRQNNLSIRDIFNKLIRYHRVCHQNCCHVYNFLEEIGFHEV